MGLGAERTDATRRRVAHVKRALGKFAARRDAE